MKASIPKQLLSLVILACVVSSCGNYEPEGIVVTPIDPPSLTGISLNLNEHPETDIAVVQKTTFTYTVATGGKRLINSRVYLNAQLIMSSASPTTSFDIDPVLLNTGSYPLHIEVTIAPETGSLADKAGAEAIIVWTDRNIKVDNDIPEEPGDPAAIAILSVENKDGTIVITWNKYDKFNFQNYRLTRTDYDGTGKITGGEDFGPITDAKQIAFPDHTYLGGKCAYTLTLTAAGQTYKSPAIPYEHPYKPRLSTSLTGNGDAIIKWTSAKALKNNFFKYRLDIVTDVGGFLQTSSYEKTIAEDTVVALSIPNFNKLGQFKDLKLSIFHQENESYPKAVKGKLMVGEPFPLFFGPYTPPHLGTDGNYYMMISGGPGLFKLSPNGVKLDSLRNSYNWMAFVRGASVAVGTVNGKPVKINLNSLTEESLSIPNVNLVRAISTDLKMVSFDATEGVKVFSAGGQPLLTIGATEIERVAISPNGEYVTALPRFYKFNGTGFDQWAFTDPYLYNSVSHLENQSRVIIGYPDRVVRFNLDTKAIEQTTTAYHGPCNYDPVSKKIGCLTSTSFAVLQPEDFSLFKSIGVNDPVNNTFYLLNETVLCPGARIKLSDIP